MKRMFSSIAFAMLLMNLLCIPGWAAELLIPVGKVIGLRLQDESVTIVAFDEVLGHHARESGLQIGDKLICINGIAITSAEDVHHALETAEENLSLTVQRGGKQRTLQITPAQTQDGPRLGVYLRQGIAGVGTVTWYDPVSGRFAALGHGVSSAKGDLLTMTQGNIYPAEILSVKRGECGQPGLLRGSADSDHVVGQLLKNTPQGVFGTTKSGWRGQPIPAASYGEIRTGPATIRSTVKGSQVQEYSVEILKIYPQDKPDNRNFLIKVTDTALLNATGGIVQGMSGSPIIQDGKLVGAVTHVLVNDPTRGYGIFIENMLEAAE